MFDSMLTQSALRRRTLLWGSFMVLGALAVESAPERPETQYQRLLTGVRSLTPETLRSRYDPPGHFREKLGFDPSKASYYSEVASALALDDTARTLYARQGFVVSEVHQHRSFGEAYHDILRRNLPVLITTDSILQTVYKSYDDLLADLEEGLLIPELQKGISKAHEALPALALEVQDPTSLEDVDLLLTVARSLLEEAPAASKRNQQARVDAVLALIEAGGAPEAAIFGQPAAFDASQFKPRGHYSRSPALRRYFRAMIWLGRTGLPLEGPYGERGWRGAALLQEASARSGAEASFALIDGIVGFMVGKSDDPGFHAVGEVRRKLGLKTLAAAFGRAKEAIAELGSGQHGGSIRSAGLQSNPDDPKFVPVPLEFRLQGQRFAIDSFFTEQVTFDRVLSHSQKIRRFLPSGLDVAFALGNDAALEPLGRELGAYPYATNLAACRAMADAQSESYWEKDLYSLWLQALRDLSRPPEGEGNHVPEVMQTRAWGLKILQTQLASYAQLRHNTVLYVKQGSSGSMTCKYPTGYVEPYPVFYAALGRYAEKGGAFLAGIQEGEVKARALTYFGNLGKTVDRLKALAEKELKTEPFAEEDLKFIKDTMTIEYPSSSPPCYNGWYPGLFYRQRKDSVLWDPIVADVFTDPGGEDHGPRVLHMGTGDVYLAVFCADSGPDRTACVGPVSSYYEWDAPGLERMSDEEWKARLQRQGPPDRPAWMAPILAVPETTFERNPRLDQAWSGYLEALKTPEGKEAAFWNLWDRLKGRSIDKRILDALEARTAEKGLPKTLRGGWAPLLADPTLEKSPMEARVSKAFEKAVKTVALKYVLKGLEDPKLCSDALEGFRNLNPQALDLDRLYSLIAPFAKDPKVRGAAVAALGAFPQPEVLPILREALQDPGEWIREQAALTLLERGDTVAYPAILKMEEERPTPNPHIVAYALIDHGFSASSLKRPREDPLGARDKSGAYYPERLLAALKVPSCDIQSRALEALQGKLPANGREAFLAYLADCDPSLFEKGLPVVESGKDPSLYPLVLAIAKKRDLTETKAFALFSASWGDRDDLPVLERAWAIADGNTWDPYSIGRLAQGILRLDPERVVQMMEKPPQDGAKRSALFNLVSQNPSPRWVPALMSWMADPEIKWWVRPDIFKASAGLPTLGDKPEDWQAWWEGAKGLPTSEWRVREVARLMPGVRSPDPKQRLSTLRSLRMYAKNLEDPAWTPLLKDTSAEVGKEALTLAFETGRPEAEEIFHAWIRTGSGEDVSAAIRILRASPSLTQEARVKLLLPELGISDPRRRGWIFSELESIGQGQAALERVLVLALADPEPAVRAGAVRAMEYRNLEPCWTRVLDLLKDPDPAVRRSALLTLSRVKDLPQKARDPACAQALLGTLGDKNADVLKLALSVTAGVKLEGASERFLPLLSRPEVAGDALMALGVLGDDRAVEALLSVAKDTGNSLRGRAIESLVQARRFAAYKGLWELSRDPDGRIRKQAGAYFQGALAYASEEDVLALAKLGPEVRQDLGYRLWSVGSPEILDWLLAEIPHTPSLVPNLQYQAKLPGAQPKILAFAKTADPSLRGPLFDVLQYSLEGPQTFDLLLAVLPPSDQMSYKHLEFLRTKSPARFLALCRPLMGDPAYKAKELLANEMCKVPTEEDRALFKSIAVNENGYEPVTRLKAWMALVRLGEPEAMAHCLRLLSRTDAEESYYFRYLAWESAPCNIVLPALIDVLGDGDPKVRGLALYLLKERTWEGFPADPHVWSDWWEQNRTVFQDRNMKD